MGMALIPNSLQIKVFIALLRVPKIKKSVVSNYQIEINIMSAIPIKWLKS
jgi:hypothetical protein